MRLILPIIILVFCACRTTNKSKSEHFISSDSTTVYSSDSVAIRKYESVKVRESFTDKKTGFNIRIVYRKADTANPMQKPLKNPLSDKLTPLEWFDHATNGQEIESIEISGDVVDNSTAKELEKGIGIDSGQHQVKGGTRVTETEGSGQSNKTSKGLAGAGWLWVVLGVIVIAFIIIKKLTS